MLLSVVGTRSVKNCNETSNEFLGVKRVFNETNQGYGITHC